MSEQNVIYFEGPRNTANGEYFIYQSPAALKYVRISVGYDQNSVIRRADYLAVAKGQFNPAVSEHDLLGELFHIYNHQDDEANETILKHYAGNSMSSGDVIELRYPDGRTSTWLCCSIGWHKLSDDSFGRYQQ